MLLVWLNCARFIKLQLQALLLLGAVAILLLKCLFFEQPLHKRSLHTNPLHNHQYFFRLYSYLYLYLQTDVAPTFTPYNGNPIIPYSDVCLIKSQPYR